MLAYPALALSSAPHSRSLAGVFLIEERGASLLPTATDLRYFLAAAEVQSIRRAAEQLGLAQPSLSMAIRRLETAIGAPLLIRSRTGVQLTRAGQRLVPKARSLLDDWAKITADAAKDETEVTGRYVVGCPEGIGLYLLPLFLPRLLGTHPTLELDLVHGFSNRITDDVLNGKIDFGLVANPMRHPDLVIKHICWDEVGMWVGSSAAGGLHPTQDPHSGQAVLISVPAFVDLTHIDSKAGVSFARTITTRSHHMVATLVAAGAGIGILPARMAALFNGAAIRPLPGTIFHVAHDICLIYRPDAHRSVGSRRLAMEIRTALELISKAEPQLLRKHG
jgi:DNA-binding transcriptional LysR family regulator